MFDKEMNMLELKEAISNSLKLQEIEYSNFLLLMTDYSKFSKYGSAFIKNMNDEKSTFIENFISIIELTERMEKDLQHSPIISSE